MIELIVLAASLGATAVGYLKSRDFVRGRLAYVDQARSPVAPFLAAVGATALAAPVVWLLPFVGGGTALLFGAGVGFGVASGARGLRQGQGRLNP